MIGTNNRLLSDGTYRYEYDGEGNRVARFIDTDGSDTLTEGDSDITQYTWDARNRLIKVTDRAVFDGLPTQVVDYLYDVENRWIGESIDEDGDGVVDRQIRFAYDGNQIVLQFEKEGEGAVTGADLSHRYLWQPDAVDQLMNAAVDCLFGFTGRPLDEATGLQNNLHRWYDPTVGRWMNKDPIGGVLGSDRI